MSLRILSILIFSIFFIACSFKAPINQWEINSSNAYNSYTKNFLSKNLEIANSNLKSSIKYAKQSANLNQLAKIYLGKCALNISVGIEDKCFEYNQIKDLEKSNSLEAYHSMLIDTLAEEQIEFLPKQYIEFYKNILNKNYNKAFESIKNSEQITSLFIASSLIKNHLTKTQIKFLIEKASYHGYKNIVLFWLKTLSKIEEDEDKKINILKRIEAIS